MSTFTRLFLLLLMLNTSQMTFPQMCFVGKNKFDHEGKKDGFWVTTSKSNPKNKTFKGWYSHGNETRRCIYYNQDGKKVFTQRFVNDSLVRIRRYDQNGKIEYKGSALWLDNKNEMRFCWDGRFVFYNSNRRIIKIVNYVRGEEQDLE